MNSAYNVMCLCRGGGGGGEVTPASLLKARGEGPPSDNLPPSYPKEAIPLDPRGMQVAGRAKARIFVNF